MNDLSASWNSRRARFLFREINDRGYDLPLASVTRDGGVEFRADLGISVWNPGDDISSYKRVQPGDFVIGLRSFQSGLGYSPLEGLVSPAYTVLRPIGSEVHGGYFRHLFKSRAFISLLENVAQGIRQGRTIATEDFYNIPLPLPPFASQRLIADYLDAETSRIDALITKKRRMIELLASKRVASRRRHFGRDSGDSAIAGLPPLPEGWRILPLRWLTECLDGRRVPLSSEQRADFQGDVPYWGANDIVDSVADHLFDEPLVLLGEDGAPFLDPERDVAFFITGKVWVNNHIHVLKPTGARPRFLMHYLNTVDYASYITGTTRDKLVQDQMGRIPVPLPPVDEQRRIEETIDEEFEAIDALSSRIVKQIDLIREHRQALITAAVTGEIDHPGAPA